MSFIKKGGEKTKKTLPEQNYQRIIQNASSISDKIGNITETLDEDDMSSDSATALATQQSIKAFVEDLINKTIAPLHFFCQDGFSEANRVWYVAHTDTNASVFCEYYIPQTRNDWKIIIFHWSDTASRTDSGLIDAGAVGDGEAISNTNIFNSVNFDLVNTAADTVYSTESSEFSASAGDLLNFYWRKDNNAGSGNLYVYGVVLTHS